MEKIHTRQPISIKHMLVKNSDRNSIQWNTTQQWKWKISMYNNMYVPHKKYWMKSQSHEKIMFVVSMVIIFWEEGGNRAGWGHKGTSEMLNKPLISWSGCRSYGCLLCGKSWNWHLWFVYSSLCMLYFNNTVYKNGPGSTYINLERYFIINESFH